MAIIWYDPLALNQGTGTYASPYQFSYTGALNLQDGDEIRLKAVDLASEYFTAELPATITASRADASGTFYITDPSFYFSVGQMGITSDGYLFSVDSIGTNYIRTSALHTMGITQSTLEAGTTTVRALGIYLPALGTSMHFPHITSTITGNVTVTDGWIDETTRVTDGSAITVIGNRTTGTSYFYLGFPGVVFDLPNTHIVCYDSGSMMIYLNNNTEITAKQICLGASGSFRKVNNIKGLDSTVTVSHMGSYSLFDGLGSYPDAIPGKITLNVTDCAAAKYHYIYRAGCDFEYNVKDILLENLLNNYLFFNSNQEMNSVKISMTGTYRYLSNYPTISLVNGTDCRYDISLGANFSVFYNKTTSLTSLTGFYNLLSPLLYGNAPRVLYSGFYTLTNNSSVSIPTNDTYVLAYSGSFNTSTAKKGMPITVYKGVPSTLSLYATSVNGDFLVHYTDGVTKRYIPNYAADSTFPTDEFLVAQEDLVTFYSKSPSISYSLNTFNANWFKPLFNYSLVQVPLNADGVTQYTISGWVKCSNTNVTEVKLVLIYDDDKKLETIVDIDAARLDWTQFNLSVTPTSGKQLAELAASITLNGSGQDLFWISDVGIV